MTLRPLIGSPRTCVDRATSLAERAHLPSAMSRAGLLLVACTVMHLAVGCRRGATRSDTDPGPVYDGGQDFSSLSAYLDGQLGDGLTGFAMQVMDAEGRVVFRREEGRCSSGMCPAGDPEFSVSLNTGIASSTKWVTSTLILAALDERVRSGHWTSVSAALDHPVVPDLACEEIDGPVTGITMRQLLSFTSGVIADHDCVTSNAALRECACTILRDSRAAMTTDTAAQTGRRAAHPPGVTYKYGNSHHAVAGAWLEAATGETWDELFERLILAPLEIDMEYTRRSNLAGSIYTSVADTSRFVDALRADALRADAQGADAQGADAQGATPQRLLSVEAVTEQRAAQARWADPALTWLVTPMEGVDYGLNVWRLCLRAFTEDDALGAVDALTDLKDPDCDEVFIYGHSGKGGYTPFIDGAGRYSAVFSMREDSPGGGADYTANELGVAARVRLLTHLAMVP